MLTSEIGGIRILIQCKEKWNWGKGRFWGTLL